MWTWKRSIGAILVLILLIPVASFWSQMTQARHRDLTRSRFRQIGMALHSYHEVYHTFPPAFVKGPDGKAWHSWRVLLLPYLGEQELAAKYRFDEPWNGPHNRDLILRCPEVFQSPAWEVQPGKTNMYALVGRRTAWPAYHCISIDRALDGPYGTLHTVEGPPVADWSEPHELSVREWTDRFRSREAGVFCGMMDGTTRFLSKTVDQTILMSLVTPRYGQLMYSGPDWPEEFTESSSLGMQTKIRNAVDLKQSRMQATSVDPLDSTHNEIWCATFQMAWDELKRQAKSDVQAGENPPVVQRLNTHPFPREALDASTYLVAASDSEVQATQSLRDAIQAKFPGFEPQLETLPDDGLPDLRLYACLVKRMPFVEQLDRFSTPLEFRGSQGPQRVRSFGREPEQILGLGEAVLVGQIVIGDYVSDQDFIVVLNTNSPQRDEIILGRVAPGSTLQEVWSHVDRRLKVPHPHRVHKDLYSGERLEIPKLEFGLSQNFSELEGLAIYNLTGENRLRTARQVISFRLDETGAETFAAAEIGVIGEFGDDTPFDPTKPRRFVFDQPFFLALRESGKVHPYLLAWIADPELMIAY